MGSSNTFGEKLKRSKKFMVVSCSHGHLIDEEASAKALRFKKKFKPDLSIHLGDFIDASAFMGRGSGTDTPADDIWRDLRRGLEFVERYEPTTLFCGNHEARLWGLLDCNNELKRDCAKNNIEKIQQFSKKMGAELVEYGSMSDPESYRLMGALALGHGWSFGMNAEREHAAITGRPTIIGHVHRMQSQPAYAFGGPEGISVGCLCDISKMKYASMRKATSGWVNGWVYGEVSEDSYELQMKRASKWTVKNIPKV